MDNLINILTGREMKLFIKIRDGLIESDSGFTSAEYGILSSLYRRGLIEKNGRTDSGKFIWKVKQNEQS